MTGLVRKNNAFLKEPNMLTLEKNPRDSNERALTVGSSFRVLGRERLGQLSFA